MTSARIHLEREKMGRERGGEFRMVGGEGREGMGWEDDEGE